MKKYSKDFTVEQIFKMVKKAFPNAIFYKSRVNIHYFKEDNELYSFFFVVSERAMDENVRVYKHINEDDLNGEYVCTIEYYHAQYYLD